MKKYLILICYLSLCACAMAKERPELEYQFPNCGISELNGKTINKVCATRDFIAPEPRKRKRDWLAFLAAEGSSGYKGPIDSVGAILRVENKELDMQGHVWDFSKQVNPDLEFRTYNTKISNGVILNVSIFLGVVIFPRIFILKNKSINQIKILILFMQKNMKINQLRIVLLTIFTLVLIMFLYVLGEGELLILN
ncbi:hypothetical protein [Acinetobacter genomosp. 15BJ]|uniref:Lipoprotein n=1 Tax=Acinetobacter genomosp. 15BJ TaxID=106651 RepID=R9B3U3_9GAMM|nr:hypothetical protein [Acinetobacter genomosp. 15BJ]EOR08935.1 hypothetical protein F896_01469 [Acinetobacter genomosp. 15BJ]MCH7293464.1 hypothetical protein [Acinetobacter genomosp. 15BJ]MDO3657109.1 hypothetical protein [Acinetobacter genomosp. 15BJ]